MKHLLVTNDYPPKIGGIQSYLWELWRRLPADDVTVLTSSYEGADAFDAGEPYRIERDKWWLLPTRALIDRINTLAAEVDAEVIILDPLLPLGWVGPHLERPYVVLGHGAEVAIPARIPGTSHILRRILDGAVGVLASGDYVAAVMQQWPEAQGKPVVSIPPGVDPKRFRVLSSLERSAAREHFGMPERAQLVVGVSRLVKRKGFDRVIEAAARLAPRFPDLRVAIAGSGRDRERLERLAEQTQAPVTFVGRVPDADLPTFLGMGDIFAMACHDRWFGFEREGFGIVFNEAAACGLPVIAGLSGGSAEAVAHEESGLVVGGGVTAAGVAQALASLLADEALRTRFGMAGRERATTVFDYDALARQLSRTLEAMAGR